MKTLSINQLQIGKKVIKPIKNLAPLVASAMLTTAAVVAAKAETAEKEASVPAAVALATILPAGVKRKENGVEMLSDEYIKTHNGKYLSKEEIQAYKDKWNFLKENNSLTDENKYIAHYLCQNSNIDNDTALNCLEKIAKNADVHYGLNYSPKKVTRNCALIINSDKINNEFLPDVLSSVRGYMEEHYINSFLKDADFVIENIKPDCYEWFMNARNEIEKINISNYKQDKITDEMVSKFESIKKGCSEACRLIHSKDSVQEYIATRTVGYYWSIEKELYTYKKEIKTYKELGLNISDIAQKLNITEDCVNALEILAPNDMY